MTDKQILIATLATKIAWADIKTMDRMCLWEIEQYELEKMAASYTNLASLIINNVYALS